MAKLLNIYALTSNGTKVEATASTVNAVSIDQVATNTALGLVKTGTNTTQGVENDKAVTYLEVNADGVGFVPISSGTDFIESTDADPATQNRVILNNDKKLIVDIDKFQHATSAQFGIVKSANDYSSYSTGAFTQAKVIFGDDGIGYANVFPATANTIGSIKVSEEIITSYPVITANQTYKSLLYKDDANVGYTLQLIASTLTPGIIKTVEPYTEYTVTDDCTKAYLVNDSNSETPYAEILPATSSILGAVKVSDEYTEYSTVNEKTVAYLMIDTTGKAYIPMITETWQFTVTDDDGNESTVEKKVVLG